MAVDGQHRQTEPRPRVLTELRLEDTFPLPVIGGVICDRSARRSVASRNFVIEWLWCRGSRAQAMACVAGLSTGIERNRFMADTAYSALSPKGELKMKIKSPKGLLALWASFLAAGGWILPIGTVLARPLPCVAAPLGATTPPSPQPVVELSGARQVNSIFVASSHCLRVTSSLRIVASSEIVVQGMIVADPGCSIELVAPAITISGALTCLHAATGDEVDAVGGQGGSIVLSAAFIDLRGAELRAGDGGDGGPSADGGDGGNPGKEGKRTCWGRRERRTWHGHPRSRTAEGQ